MSENEKAHDEVRIKPSIESLRLAIEAGKGQTWAAERIIASAALFDLYLREQIGFAIDDRNSRLENFDHSIPGRIKISIIRINDHPVSAICALLRSGNGPGDVPDQVFSGHSTLFGRSSHDSTPVVDKQHPADSSSTGCSKSVTKSNNETAAPALHSGPVAPVDQPVVDLLKTLPIDELHALQKRIVPEDLISDLCGHASDELRRRRQQ